MPKRKIEAFTSGIRDADDFFGNEMVFDATLMNFVVLGEVVDKISQETQAQYPDIPWPQIKSFRNVIAHAYFGVDAEEVWQIIIHDLPRFKSRLEEILGEG